MCFTQTVVVSKNKDANQRTENWHWILSQRKPKTLRLGSVGEWSWLCPCSSSTVIWHMQRFALLQALRHWSKQPAPARPGNNNRNKGTNDFVPTLTWCLPPACHGLPAYPLSPSCSLSLCLFHTPHIHPVPPQVDTISTCGHFEKVVRWSVMTSLLIHRTWTGRKTT